MINRFVQYLIKQNIIKPEDAEVQIFALTFLTQTLICHGAIFVLAAVFRVLPETILFELVFMPLRSYAGGYHASTQTKCFVLSLSIWGLIMYLGTILPSSFTFAILPIAFLMIWMVAPVPHKNNPIGPIRFSQVKKISRGLVCFDVLLSILFYALGWQHYALGVSLTLLAVALSLFVAKQDTLRE